MSKEFRQKLEKFRADLEAMQKERRQQRLQLARELEQGAKSTQLLRQLSPSPDVNALMEDVRTLVGSDIRRYSAQHEVPSSAPAVTPVGTYTQHLRSAMHTWLQGLPMGTQTAHLPFGAAVLVSLLDKELSELTGENVLQGTMAAAIVPKLKLLQPALTGQRYTDALTILRTMQRSDPHNPLLLFMLSQLLYFMAGHGQHNVLPEARDFAQRSIIFTDKIPAEKLWHYRYHAIASELAHDADKALGWLRDTGMLAPELMGADWSKLGFAGLRGWGLLSYIPARHWSENEFDLLRELVDHVTGGALLYLMWFRQGLIEEAAERKNPLPQIETIEKHVQLAWSLYGMTGTPLKELTGRTGETPWIVRTRYVQTLLQAGGAPEFDHVLLHIALNGETWCDAPPDREIRSLMNSSITSYWRLWAVSLTYQRELRQTHLLPAQEVLEDQPIGSQLQELLTMLQENEQSRIKADIWEDLKPWMVRWNMEHLLAAGSGSNQPRLRFAPTLSPFSLLYHHWCAPSPQDVLASPMIIENAKRGAFASMFEVVAAFDGAYRLVDDPVHGLVPSQKRALNAARKQKPEKFGDVGFDENLSAKLAVWAVPLLFVLVTVGIFHMADNLGQAIGLVLAMGGVCGVAIVRLLK